MSLLAYRQITKAIDAGRIPTSSEPGSTLIRPQWLKVIREWMEQAEKFDFGELVLERMNKPKFPDHPELGAGYVIPELTQVEAECWRDNLIPVPAPFCWYEFSLSGYPAGILLTDDGETLKVIRMDWVKGEAVLPGLMWECTHAEWVKAEEESRDLMMHVGGNAMLARAMQTASPGWLVSDSSNVSVAIYLTLMLNSKTTERVVRPKGSVTLAKARGVTPRPAHTIVRIVPERYLREAEAEAKRTHASPRLHWRRSHVRTYDKATPNSRPYKDGKWAIVIPRVLVNLAKAKELGEVSHQYWMAKVKARSSEEAA